MYCLIAVERESWTDFRNGICRDVRIFRVRAGEGAAVGDNTSSILDLERKFG